MTPRRLLPAAATFWLLAGCASPPGALPPTPLPAASAAEQSCTAALAPPLQGFCACLKEDAAAAETLPATHADAAAELLLYADRVRGMDAAALAREAAGLTGTGESADTPDLRLALVLAQTRQPADTARALGLVQRTLTQPDAAPLHPLARLLEARLLQQRRLEEQLERANQQLREVQRRNDLLDKQLEAMRALERSLNKRPSARAAKDAH